MKSPVEPESTSAFSEIRRFPTNIMTDSMSLESDDELPLKVMEDIWNESPAVGCDKTGGEGGSSVT